MASRTNSDNIKIEPVYATWENQQVVKVTCVADVADALNETYISFSSTTAEFYAWISTDMGVDPAIAGKTAIPVAADTGDTGADLAALFVTAINANANFHAAADPNDSDSFFIMNKIAGEVLSAAADGAGMAATGFTVATTREGAKLEVGFIDGDIEVGLTEDILDVTSHQTGTQIIQALRTGRNIGNMALAMKESDAAKLKQIIEASGVEYTPSGMGATPVSAWGSEDVKAFGNIGTDARKLVLHPLTKNTTDYSEDFCFWRAYPLLQGVTVSGENPRIINVEFKIIPDPMLKSEARQFVYGDHTQNFLA